MVGYRQRSINPKTITSYCVRKNPRYGVGKKSHTPKHTHPHTLTISITIFLLVNTKKEVTRIIMSSSTLQTQVERQNEREIFRKDREDEKETRIVKNRGRDSVQRIRYDCACVYVCERERERERETRSILTQRIEYASLMY